MSFLGCQNNRLQQMRKMAKGVALRLAEKVKAEKDEKNKEAAALEKAKDKNNNARNKSTTNSVNPPRAPNSIVVAKLGNTRKPESVGVVKLPKVSTIGSSSVSNTSVKAIWEGGGIKKNGAEGIPPTTGSS
jgi:hypothetical protein